MTTQTKHDGLIRRLHERHQSINKEAADAIEALTAENKKMREALQIIVQKFSDDEIVEYDDMLDVIKVAEAALSLTQREETDDG